MLKKYKVLFMDIFRNIWNTRSRFLSIFIIVALGVGFFSGLKSVYPDMKITAEKYFLDYNLMDMHIKSTMGFNKNDIESLKNIKEIKDLSTTYSVDVFAKDKDNSNIIIRAHSLESSSHKGNIISKPILKNGRFPQNKYECVIEQNLLSSGTFKIGDKITFFSGDKDKDISDILKVKTFKIVGTIENPMYISLERGKSQIGDGNIDGYVMVPKEIFNYDVFTDVYLTLKDTENISPFEKQYDDAIKNKTDEVEKIANSRKDDRYNEIIKEAKDKINDSKKQIDDAVLKREYELKKGQKQIDDANLKLKEARNEYNKNLEYYNKSLEDGKNQIDYAKSKIEKGKEEYENAVVQFNVGKSQFEKEKSENIKKANELSGIINNLEDLLQGKITDYNTQLMLIEQAKKVPDIGQVLYESLFKYIHEGDLLSKNQSQQILNNLNQNINNMYIQFDNTEKYFNDSENKLKASKKEIDKNSNDLKLKEQEFNDKMAQGKIDLLNADTLINENIKKIQESQKKYDNKKKESEIEIINAKNKIAIAEKDISNIKPPKWFILNRNDNPGYSDYDKDAERVDRVAKVFPVFFILVAMLVCLTTMTRMVEEQRTQIGTLKALGYGKGAIISKYIIYAVLASILGSLVGLIIGFKLFPKIIFRAYRVMYIMPPIITPFRWDYAIWCTLAAVLFMSIATFLACYKELLTVPSQLMRPKPPKSGKRVFIEKINFIWSKMNFIQKVTVRNIFRYKRRMIMTVVGIAGCTALMLTGFALKYSMSEIVSRQFGEIFKYDLIGMIDDKGNHNDIKEIRKQLSNNTYIKDSMYVVQKNLDVSKNNEIQNVYLFVPENSKDLNKYITLRNRAQNKKIQITNEGVVINEKLAKLLSVNVGDEFTLHKSEGESVNVKVSAITENYTNNYVYMSTHLYKKIFNKDPAYNTFIANMSDKSKEKEISTELLKNKNILGISYMSEGGEKFNDIVKNLNYIVLVIIISAGTLAFVVFYNLSNINISEREREIATIKVLGFYDSEVSAYIYRENIIFAIMGIIFGLFLGILLHHFVIITSEVDDVMFAHDINLASFIFATILTLIFTLTVNIVLHFKLKKVNMIESLKSIE